jgi:integrase
LHLEPNFTGSLRGITLAAVEAFVARRVADGAAASTVNNALTVLSHILRRAVAWEHLGNNPIAGMKRLKEPPGRTRFLAPEEIEKLFSSFPTEQDRSPLVCVYLKPFLLVAFNTGMRRSEILGLTRRSVDWQNRMVTLDDTKNGQKRHVFLNEAALAAIRSLPPRLDTQRLFPFNGAAVTMALRRILKRAGIEDFRLHDGRHLFASYHAMAGLQPRALQELLGHKDARMTMRYSHLANAYLRAAVDQVVITAPKAETASENGTYLAPVVVDGRA